MKFTVKEFDNKLIFINEKKKITSLQGYSFHDEYDNCIIIAYGETRRDFLIEHLSGNTNELKLKYKYITLS